MRSVANASQGGRRGATLVAAVAVAAALGLSGCAAEFNVRKAMGLQGDGPDEFAVVKKKPLEMPPSLQLLPEPEPGAPSRVDPRPAEAAQAALTGGSTMTLSREGAPSPSESAFLAAAGADQSDPEIRKRLETDDDDTGGYLLDGLIGRSKKDEDLLDAKEEAERLAEEARRGKNPRLERLPEPETDEN